MSEVNKETAFKLGGLLESLNSRTSEPIQVLASGDLCDLYLCTQVISAEKPERLSRWELLRGEDDVLALKLVLKVCRSTKDEDLVSNEITVIDRLYPREQKEERFYRYLVKPISFVLNPRRAFLMPYLEGYVSLEHVLKAYPDGLDYRDVAWMFKRLLEGLGFVHAQGIVHGALLPPHVMVHPTDHGAKIIDWSYAVMGKNSIKAYPAAWKNYYPPEVFARRFPTSATDIFMAAKVALALLGGDICTGDMPDKVPTEIRELLRSCFGELPSSRPQDAWELHEQLDMVLQNLVGKPTYRPLHLPADKEIA